MYRARRAGGEDVARQPALHMRNERHELRWAECHVGDGILGVDGSVVYRRHLERGDVGNLIRRHELRPEGEEGVEALDDRQIARVEADVYKRQPPDGVRLAV